MQPDTSVSDQPSRASAVILWVLCGLVIAAAVVTGLSVRRQAYDLLIPLHFRSDINRGWGWGYYTFQNMHDHGRSFLDTYDDVGIQDRAAPMWIDYAPARLAVMTAWAAWNHSGWPYAKRTDDWAFQAFFVRFNTAMELAAAAGAFLLTRRVVRLAIARQRCVTPGDGLLPALAAGLLLWFNPAMILSSHGWPCGDGWVIAPFLWAIYFAHRRQSFVAGIVLGIGVLFKGQLFFVAPLLLLWPLFQGRWRAILWLLGGFAGTFGLLTVGWTLTRVDAGHMRHIVWPAVACVVGVIAVTLGLLVARRYERTRALRVLTIRPTLAAGFGLAGAMAFAGMWLFGTSFAWFDASYCFGRLMVMGVTSNLPGILQAHYGWHNPAETVMSIAQHPVSLRTLLFAIFALLLVITALGMALQDALKSRRFLLAIVTPWLLFFVIPAQIHERYLLFAAAVSAVCCGYSAGMALLGVFMTVVTTLMTLQVMLIAGQKPAMDALLTPRFPALFPKGNTFAYTMQRVIEGTHPDIGWALLLLAGIFVYFTILPDRRGRVPVLVAEPIDVEPVDVEPVDAEPLDGNAIEPERVIIAEPTLATEAIPCVETPSGNPPPRDDGPIPLA